MLGHPEQDSSCSAQRGSLTDCLGERACCKHGGTAESPDEVLGAKGRVWVPAQGAAIPVGSQGGKALLHFPCMG